jgi:hypothetical protein
MSKVLPYLTLAIALLGAIGWLVNLYFQKDEYSISASSCSESGPEKVYLENLDTGYRVQLPTGAIPTEVERITNITNAGKKSIGGEYIYISVDNHIGAKIFQTTIFYESPLSQHELVADEAGTKFRVKLKNFNPGDRLSVLVASDREIGLDVLSKGAGYTLQSSFQRKGSCDVLSTLSYGGTIAYSKVADGCTLNKTDLSLGCTGTGLYPIPPNFPPGRARLIFE